MQGYCKDDGHPAPPNGTHLVMPANGRVTEYKYKSYECESGYRCGQNDGRVTGCVMMNDALFPQPLADPADHLGRGQQHLGRQVPRAVHRGQCEQQQWGQRLDCARVLADLLQEAGTISLFNVFFLEFLQVLSTVF